MKIKGIYLVLCLLVVTVENDALQIAKARVSDVRYNAMLLKMLHYLDSAPNDNNFFKRSLKLITGLCMCMQQILDESTRKTLNVRNNLNSENRKIKYLYSKIYNETCTLLRNQVSSRIINSSNSTSNPISNARQTQSDDSKFRNIIHLLFNKTKSKHVFTIQNRNIFEKLVAFKRPSHSVIVIITIHSSIHNAKEVYNDTEPVTDSEVESTIKSLSSVDIDIIDGKYGPRNNASRPKPIIKPVFDCHLRSVYTFLISSENNKSVKIFKILRRKGKIKLYIDILAHNDHEDFSSMCCFKKSQLCEMNLNDTVNLLRGESTEKFNIDFHSNYKDTVTSIKNLLNIYIKELDQNTVNASTDCIRPFGYQDEVTDKYLYNNTLSNLNSLISKNNNLSLSYLMNTTSNYRIKNLILSNTPKKTLANHAAKTLKSLSNIEISNDVIHSMAASSIILDKNNETNIILILRHNSTENLPSPDENLPQNSHESSFESKVLNEKVKKILSNLKKIGSRDQIMVENNEIPDTNGVESLRLGMELKYTKDKISKNHKDVEYSSISRETENISNNSTVKSDSTFQQHMKFTLYPEKMIDKDFFTTTLPETFSKQYATSLTVIMPKVYNKTTQNYHRTEQNRFVTENNFELSTTTYDTLQDKPNSFITKDPNISEKVVNTVMKSHDSELNRLYTITDGAFNETTLKMEKALIQSTDQIGVIQFKLKPFEKIKSFRKDTQKPTQTITMSYDTTKKYQESDLIDNNDHLQRETSKELQFQTRITMLDPNSQSTNNKIYSDLSIITEVLTNTNLALHNKTPKDVYFLSSKDKKTESFKDQVNQDLEIQMNDKNISTINSTTRELTSEINETSTHRNLFSPTTTSMFTKKVYKTVPDKTTLNWANNIYETNSVEVHNFKMIKSKLQSNEVDTSNDNEDYKTIFLKKNNETVHEKSSSSVIKILGNLLNTNRSNTTYLPDRKDQKKYFVPLKSSVSVDSAMEPFNQLDNAELDEYNSSDKYNSTNFDISGKLLQNMQPNNDFVNFGFGESTNLQRIQTNETLFSHTLQDNSSQINKATFTQLNENSLDYYATHSYYLDSLNNNIYSLTTLPKNVTIATEESIKNSFKNNNKLHKLSSNKSHIDQIAVNASNDLNNSKEHLREHEFKNLQTNLNGSVQKIIALKPSNETPQIGESTTKGHVKYKLVTTKYIETVLKNNNEDEIGIYNQQISNDNENILTNTPVIKRSKHNEDKNLNQVYKMQRIIENSEQIKKISQQNSILQKPILIHRKPGDLNTEITNRNMVDWQVKNKIFGHSRDIGNSLLSITPIISTDILLNDAKHKGTSSMINNNSFKDVKLGRNETVIEKIDKMLKIIQKHKNKLITDKDKEKNVFDYNRPNYDSEFQPSGHITIQTSDKNSFDVTTTSKDFTDYVHKNINIHANNTLYSQLNLNVNLEEQTQNILDKYKIVKFSNKSVLVKSNMLKEENKVYIKDGIDNRFSYKKPHFTKGMLEDNASQFQSTQFHVIFNKYKPNISLDRTTPTYVMKSNLNVISNKNRLTNNVFGNANMNIKSNQNTLNKNIIKEMIIAFPTESAQLITKKFFNVSEKLNSKIATLESNKKFAVDVAKIVEDVPITNSYTRDKNPSTAKIDFNTAQATEPNGIENAILNLSVEHNRNAAEIKQATKPLLRFVNLTTVQVLNANLPKTIGLNSNDDHHIILQERRTITPVVFEPTYFENTTRNTIKDIKKITSNDMQSNYHYSIGDYEKTDKINLKTTPDTKEKRYKTIFLISETNQYRTSPKLFENSIRYTINDHNISAAEVIQLREPLHLKNITLNSKEDTFNKNSLNDIKYVKNYTHLVDTYEKIDKIIRTTEEIKLMRLKKLNSSTVRYRTTPIPRENVVLKINDDKHIDEERKIVAQMLRHFESTTINSNKDIKTLSPNYIMDNKISSTAKDYLKTIYIINFTPKQVNKPLHENIDLNSNNTQHNSIEEVKIISSQVSEPTDLKEITLNPKKHTIILSSNGSVENKIYTNLKDFETNNKFGPTMIHGTNVKHLKNIVLNSKDDQHKILEEINIITPQVSEPIYFERPILFTKVDVEKSSSNDMKSINQYLIDINETTVKINFNNTQASRPNRLKSTLLISETDQYRTTPIFLENSVQNTGDNHDRSTATVMQLTEPLRFEATTLSPQKYNFGKNSSNYIKDVEIYTHSINRYETTDKTLLVTQVTKSKRQESESAIQKSKEGVKKLFSNDMVNNKKYSNSKKYDKIHNINNLSTTQVSEPTYFERTTLRSKENIQTLSSNDVEDKKIHLYLKNDHETRNIVTLTTTEVSTVNQLPHIFLNSSLEENDIITPQKSEPTHFVRTTLNSEEDIITSSLTDIKDVGIYPYSINRYKTKDKIIIKTQVTKPIELKNLIPNSKTEQHRITPVRLKNGVLNTNYDEHKSINEISEIAVQVSPTLFERTTLYSNENIKTLSSNNMNLKDDQHKRLEENGIITPPVSEPTHFAGTTLNSIQNINTLSLKNGKDVKMYSYSINRYKTKDKTIIKTQVTKPIRLHKLIPKSEQYRTTRMRFKNALLNTNYDEHRSFDEGSKIAAHVSQPTQLNMTTINSDDIINFPSHGKQGNKIYPDLEGNTKTTPLINVPTVQVNKALQIKNTVLSSNDNQDRRTEEKNIITPQGPETRFQNKALDKKEDTRKITSNEMKSIYEYTKGKYESTEKINFAMTQTFITKTKRLQSIFLSSNDDQHKSLDENGINRPQVSESTHSKENNSETELYRTTPNRLLNDVLNTNLVKDRSYSEESKITAQVSQPTYVQMTTLNSNEDVNILSSHGFEEETTKTKTTPIINLPATQVYKVLQIKNTALNSNDDQYKNNKEKDIITTQVSEPIHFKVTTFNLKDSIQKLSSNGFVGNQVHPYLKADYKTPTTQVSTANRLKHIFLNSNDHHHKNLEENGIITLPVSETTHLQDTTLNSKQDINTFSLKDGKMYPYSSNRYNMTHKTRPTTQATKPIRLNKLIPNSEIEQYRTTQMWLKNALLNTNYDEHRSISDGSKLSAHVSQPTQFKITTLNSNEDIINLSTHGIKSYKIYLNTENDFKTTHILNLTTTQVGKSVQFENILPNSNNNQDKRTEERKTITPQGPEITRFENKALHKKEEIKKKNANKLKSIYEYSKDKYKTTNENNLTMTQVTKAKRLKSIVLNSNGDQHKNLDKNGIISPLVSEPTQFEEINSDTNQNRTTPNVFKNAVINKNYVEDRSITEKQITAKVSQPTYFQMTSLNSNKDVNILSSHGMQGSKIYPNLEVETTKTKITPFIKLPMTQVYKALQFKNIVLNSNYDQYKNNKKGVIITTRVSDSIHFKNTSLNSKEIIQTAPSNSMDDNKIYPYLKANYKTHGFINLTTTEIPTANHLRHIFLNSKDNQHIIIEEVDIFTPTASELTHFVSTTVNLKEGINISSLNDVKDVRMNPYSMKKYKATDKTIFTTQVTKPMHLSKLVLNSEIKHYRNTPVPLNNAFLNTNDDVYTHGSELAAQVSQPTHFVRITPDSNENHKTISSIGMKNNKNYSKSINDSRQTDIINLSTTQPTKAVRIKSIVSKRVSLQHKSFEERSIITPQMSDPITLEITTLKSKEDIKTLTLNDMKSIHHYSIKYSDTSQKSNFNMTQNTNAKRLKSNAQISNDNKRESLEEKNLTTPQVSEPSHFLGTTLDSKHDVNTLSLTNEKDLGMHPNSINRYITKDRPTTQATSSMRFNILIPNSESEQYRMTPKRLNNAVLNTNDDEHRNINEGSTISAQVSQSTHFQLTPLNSNADFKTISSKRIGVNKIHPNSEDDSKTTHILKLPTTQVYDALQIKNTVLISNDKEDKSIEALNSNKEINKTALNKLKNIYENSKDTYETTEKINLITTQIKSKRLKSIVLNPDEDQHKSLEENSIITPQVSEPLHFIRTSLNSEQTLSSNFVKDSINRYKTTDKTVLSTEVSKPIRLNKLIPTSQTKQYTKPPIRLENAILNTNDVEDKSIYESSNITAQVSQPTNFKMKTLNSNKDSKKLSSYRVKSNKIYPDLEDDFKTTNIINLTSTQVNKLYQFENIVLNSNHNQDKSTEKKNTIAPQAPETTRFERKTLDTKEGIKTFNLNDIKSIFEYSETKNKTTDKINLITTQVTKASIVLNSNDYQHKNLQDIDIIAPQVTEPTYFARTTLNPKEDIKTLSLNFVKDVRIIYPFAINGHKTTDRRFLTTQVTKSIWLNRLIPNLETEPYRSTSISPKNAILYTNDEKHTNIVEGNKITAQLSQTPHFQITTRNSNLDVKNASPHGTEGNKSYLNLKDNSKPSHITNLPTIQTTKAVRLKNIVLNSNDNQFNSFEVGEKNTTQVPETTHFQITTLNSIESIQKLSSNGVAYNKIYNNLNDDSEINYLINLTTTQVSTANRLRRIFIPNSETKYYTTTPIRLNSALLNLNNGAHRNIDEESKITAQVTQPTRFQMKTLNSKEDVKKLSSHALGRNKIYLNTKKDSITNQLIKLPTTKVLKALQINNTVLNSNDKSIEEENSIMPQEPEPTHLKRKTLNSNKDVEKFTINEIKSIYEYSKDSYKKTDKINLTTTPYTKRKRLKSIVLNSNDDQHKVFEPIYYLINGYKTSDKTSFTTQVTKPNTINKLIPNSEIEQYKTTPIRPSNVLLSKNDEDPISKDERSKLMAPVLQPTHMEMININSNAVSFNGIKFNKIYPNLKDDSKTIHKINLTTTQTTKTKRFKNIVLNSNGNQLNNIKEGHLYPTPVTEPIQINRTNLNLIERIKTSPSNSMADNNIYANRLRNIFLNSKDDPHKSLYENGIITLPVSEPTHLSTLISRKRIQALSWKGMADNKINPHLKDDYKAAVLINLTMPPVSAANRLRHISLNSKDYQHKSLEENGIIAPQLSELTNFLRAAPNVIEDSNLLSLNYVKDIIMNSHSLNTYKTTEKAILTTQVAKPISLNILFPNSETAKYRNTPIGLKNALLNTNYDKLSSIDGRNKIATQMSSPPFKKTTRHPNEDINNLSSYGTKSTNIYTNLEDKHNTNHITNLNTIQVNKSLQFDNIVLNSINNQDKSTEEKNTITLQVPETTRFERKTLDIKDDIKTQPTYELESTTLNSNEDIKTLSSNDNVLMNENKIYPVSKDDSKLTHIINLTTTQVPEISHLEIKTMNSIEDIKTLTLSNMKSINKFSTDRYKTTDQVTSNTKPATKSRRLKNIFLDSKAYLYRTSPILFENAVKYTSDAHTKSPAKTKQVSKPTRFENKSSMEDIKKILFNYMKDVKIYSKLKNKYQKTNKTISTMTKAIKPIRLKNTAVNSNDRQNSKIDQSISTTKPTHFESTTLSSKGEIKELTLLGMSDINVYPKTIDTHKINLTKQSTKAMHYKNNTLNSTTKKYVISQTFSEKIVSNASVDKYISTSKIKPFTDPIRFINTVLVSNEDIKTLSSNRMINNKIYPYTFNKFDMTDKTILTTTHATKPIRFKNIIQNSIKDHYKSASKITQITETQNFESSNLDSKSDSNQQNIATISIKTQVTKPIHFESSTQNSKETIKTFPLNGLQDIKIYPSTVEKYNDKINLTTQATKPVRFENLLLGLNKKHFKTTLSISTERKYLDIYYDQHPSSTKIDITMEQVTQTTNLENTMFGLKKFTNTFPSNHKTFENEKVYATNNHFQNSDPVTPIMWTTMDEDNKTLANFRSRSGSQNKYSEVTSWWLDDMYLKVRLPLPINSNPGMVFPKRHFAKIDEVADLGALFIDDLLDYKEMLDRGELPLERATSREKGQPLCMEQFYRLLGVCRIPEVGKDRLELPIMKNDGSENEELVVVACRNYLYPIPVKAVDRGRLTAGEIQAQLLHCMVDAAGAPPAPRVGLLTSMNRDHWAQAREKLIRDENNRSNLELISRALCLLCLDEAGGDRADVDEDTNAFLRAMHGGGTKYHSANRWFDKTVQLIISSDGSVGMCYEHSPAEGVAVVRLAERALARAEVADRPAPPPVLLPAPQAFKWNLTDELMRTIDQAGRDLDRNISDLDFKVYTYKGYGREFMKSCRTSPDVYIQLALQYAYYKYESAMSRRFRAKGTARKRLSSISKLIFKQRMYGCLVSTYESASLRRFRGGRVDNIRAAHAPALAWAAAMCAAETPPLGDADDGAKKVSFNLYGERKKLELFEEAARKQTSVMEANILGLGIDNHLLALRETAREALGELPALFTDDSYKRMIEFKLSTSQVTTTTDGTFMGYGAVVPDGYGCSYNPKKDHVIFCIGSFVSSSVTNTDAFTQSLEEALDSMKLMFQNRMNEN